MILCKRFMGTTIPKQRTFASLLFEDFEEIEDLKTRSNIIGQCFFTSGKIGRNSDIDSPGFLKRNIRSYQGNIEIGGLKHFIALHRPIMGLR